MSFLHEWDTGYILLNIDCLQPSCMTSLEMSISTSQQHMSFLR
jgi:hypothetical protein